MASRKHGKPSTPTSRPANESTPTTGAQATSNAQSNITTPAISTTRLPTTATTSSGKHSEEVDNADKKVIVITTKSEFDKNLEEAGNKLVLVEFFASWCGPCRLLSPKLEQLAVDYEDKVFVMKMDVDECEEVPMEYGVSSMPTFLFMRNKKKIELFVGSNSDKLIRRLERLCDPKKCLISPEASATSCKQTVEPQTANDISDSSKKLKTGKANEAEESAASSVPKSAASSSAKKTAAK